MKPESPFSKLPSLSELLSHPTVAQVVKRVNQTTIAQRATGFLEELQSNVRSRWEQGHVPSLGQLAERFARRLLGPAQTSLPAVNATGTLLGNDWPAVPLAEPAVDEIVRLASEYHASSQELMGRVHQSLSALTGAEGALVVSSYRAATEMVRSRNIQIDVARFAGFINPAEHQLNSFATLAERVGAGSELIIADGAGLIGGPACGIIIGKRNLIEAVSHDSLASLTKTDNLALAALAATLAIYEKNERVVYQIPLWQLLTTPLENLEQRAHRIATILSASDRIASATPMRIESAWCDADGTQLEGPSWSVVLKSNDGFHDRNLESLHNANPQIFARLESDEIGLDLRGVFPRWDQHLASIFG